MVSIIRLVTAIDYGNWSPLRVPPQAAHPQIPVESTDDYLRQLGINPANIKIDIQSETPEERRSCLRREERKAQADLIKELLLYAVGVLLVGALIIGCTNNY
ncbi:hypothetical protein [Leptolyngbya sp. FACHB-711]|uniref:hypothetical protein n=1 Tax=Leptolyngbya sp. FACHB-711 TaxID=2692813 RepID=UPI0016841E25|nr:hypothetical protein [Leptolyngbya sp. FACHB-711]MBD1850887.1 hypothetical protein [Cyanobacteria bacterium FACHB-502]MBD2027808.1 hypothetical protein [Leptolyngbya sp. FACHB-711]